ncbi:aromatic ring-hydroxylating dioxygenase subunit alpha [Marinomonas piezotolerans]|uniref:Aromatic ring-hydroxylating dioxygenase subunit alpha n=1 Tax=Marinomonas piezotolerans TaxID=2213058 RepID=A0A370UB41_9GAMM|nr:aromatic ring-hydroxylating dioxygenase subunit alpha [Marinomonas piezotolerans]RDL45017.1 aromatic ring-hydroxylating dioxygenase subunit alpha [Marinomonas piezotolerans]
MTTKIDTHRIPLVALDAVRQPIANAKGMPNAVYEDPELFEFERDHVIGKSWAGLAFDGELPKNGFAKPVDFMGLPLAIMRNREGEVKVFHNICSHRGMILISEEVEVEGMVRCPYHSWTYDLNGNLKGTPHIGGIGKHKTEGFACEDHGLKEIRSVIWMGIIFINLSGDAVDFDHFIQPLLERWEEFTGKDGLEKVRLAHSGSSVELDLKTNWKLPVENFCEAYHLPWVHPGLNSYSPLDQHYNITINEYMSGQGSYTYNLADVAGISLPQFADWPEDKIRQAEYVAIYPNVMVGVQADHFFAFILMPQASDRTLEKIQLTYVGEEAIGDKYEACRSAVADSWKVVFGEDIFAVEGMQKGRKSPAFEGGVFSPVHDEPSHNFHQWVANQYAKALG